MKLTKIVEDLYQQMTGQTDDHEVEMAITDLRAMAKMAGELAQHLENEKPKDLEGWVQAKITKAADYMEAVYKNHMYSPDQECHTCGDKSINEGHIQIFSLAKPYDKSDAPKLRAAADDYIKFLQSKNYTTQTGAAAIYFPDFTWAAKLPRQEWIGVLVGSSTMVMSPIGENREFKFGEHLLSKLISDGKFNAYLLKGSMNEVASTCCGRCGHKHVKGTSCPKPFLTGKRHCRNRS